MYMYVLASVFVCTCISGRHINFNWNNRRLVGNIQIQTNRLKSFVIDYKRIYTNFMLQKWSK